MRAEPDRHLRDRLLRLSDLQNRPAVEPLIDELLYRDTLAQLSGAPGCYKSFLAIAMCCALASGKSVGGLKIPRAGTVVYVAAEGANGLAVRVLAWCEHWGIDVALFQDRLFFVDVPIQLGVSTDVEQAAEVVAERNADLVVLDTRARCTVGLEENSATSQPESTVRIGRLFSI